MVRIGCGNVSSVSSIGTVPDKTSVDLNPAPSDAGQSLVIAHSVVAHLGIKL